MCMKIHFFSQGILINKWQQEYFSHLAQGEGRILCKQQMLSLSLIPGSHAFGHITISK